MGIALGVKAKDRITDFEGVVTGRCEYLTGCNQVLIVPKATGGKAAEGAWFDEQRVEVLDAPRMTLDNGRQPGPDAPPSRNY